ncbi:resolvase [Clostridia bacterium]|nr:resolvase [Clostridia bacterium]
MHIYGYARVSTAEQNLNRQLDAMAAIGIPSEHIFVDKLSGKDKERPQLINLMATVQPGDKVIVESISRFARNTRDLLELVEQLAAKKVEFVSQKECIDTTTPTGKFMLTVFGAVAELERDFILQRQAEGIKSSKDRGEPLGRPYINAPDNFANIISQLRTKQITEREARQICGLSRTTFYRRLNEIQLN